MKKNILSIIAIVISIVAIAFSLLRVAPFSVAEETFIGTMVTIISIIVTIVVAYQFYGAITGKNEINNLINKSEKELEKFNLQHNEHIKDFQKELAEATLKFDEKVEILRKEQKFSDSATTGYLYSMDRKRVLESFTFNLDALYLCLELDKKEQYTSSLRNLKNTITFMEYVKTYAPEPNRERVLKDFELNIFEAEKKISNHPNYPYIKDRFQNILALIRRRIEKSLKGEDLNQEEWNEIHNYMKDIDTK